MLTSSLSQDNMEFKIKKKVKKNIYDQLQYTILDS